MHNIVFSVDISSEISPFQSLNYQEDNLKVQLLIETGYYIVPNPSTYLIYLILIGTAMNLNQT